MNFQPEPPPQNPDSPRQRDALQKGQGRAIQWAKSGRLTDQEAVIDACLHDQRFDSQLEDERIGWLWRIIAAIGAEDRVRERLRPALENLIEQEDPQQLCALARRYAERGDAKFRASLYRIVADKPFPQLPWLAEEDIVCLDGEAGLVFAARIRGSELDQQGEWFDDGGLVDRAIELLGEARALDALEKAAEKEPAVRRFYSAWQAARRARASPDNSRQAHADRMRAITVEDVMAAVEAGDRLGGSLRGWGMFAEERDLQTVLDKLLACRESKELVSYLKVFSNRPCPAFDMRLLELLSHDDEEVRRRAFAAVAQNSHPSIRGFIERAIADDRRDYWLIKLFVRNFRSRDEELLEDLIPSGDENHRHWAYYDVLNVLEKNPEADCSRLGFLTYEDTPCGACRHRAAKLLLERTSPPEWLAEECRYDSVEETRALAGEPPWED